MLNFRINYQIMLTDENTTAPEQTSDSSVQDSQDVDGSQGNVGGSDPTNQNTQQGEPKMIEADRFNKLQSHYQTSLQKVREYEGKQQYYQQLEQELQRLRQGAQQPQPKAPSQQGARFRPDMTPDEFAEELEKSWMTKLQTQAQTYQQQQEQMRQEQFQAQRVEKYNSRFDQVKSFDPDVDEAAMRQWMEENEVWNPTVAYKSIYGHVLDKQKEGKMRQEVAEKIQKNGLTRVEGNNRQGSIPQPEADKTTKDAREQGFINLLQGAP